MLTAAFVVLAVMPSTLDVRLPSNETTPTNNVKIIPKNHVILDLKKFPNLLICILSVILDIIESTAIIETTGIIIVLIIFAINCIKNNTIGSINPTVAMLPVYVISVISNGTKLKEKPTNFSIVSFMVCNTSAKFDIIIVTIKIY